MLRAIQDFDWLLLVTALILVGIGVVFIWSATYRPDSDGRGGGGPETFKQLLWLGISLFAFVVAVSIDYTWFRRYAYLLYGLGLASLLFVALFGKTVNFSKRWISLGPMNVQPSEFLKIALVLAIARSLMYCRERQSFKVLLLPLALTAVPMAMIVMQPDLGMTLTMVPIVLSMLFAAGVSLKYLGGLVGCGLFASPVVWHFLMQPRQKARILSFINLEVDPLGSGYQLIQSLLAIGSGGLTGRGLGMGTQTQLKYLAEGHTDFIFAVLVEEWGTLGGGVCARRLRYIALALPGNRLEDGGTFRSPGCGRSNDRVFLSVGD